jgi:predicted CopG family antitoxin
MHMAKTISLSDEAYNLLKSIKRRDESFSDVIKRLIGNKGNLSELLDLYPELKDSEDFEVAVEKAKKSIDNRIRRVLDEMS